MSERHVLVTVRRGPDAGAALVVRPGDRAVIGRAADATLPLRDERLSRHHAALELTERGLLVQDLGSRNGSVLGGFPLPPLTPTLAGPVDVLGLGEHVLELRLVEGAPAAPGEGSVQQDYELLREVGRGAAARVLAARHRASGRPVAIKLLLDRLAEGVGGRERLLREGEVCRRIEDEHVVRVLEVRVEAGQVFVVMEWVDGPTAQQLIAKGPLPVDRALHVAEGVARGLCAVHAAGVVHRDVKPTNVLLTSTGVVKLADLGLCRELTPGGTLTATGAGLGTLAYVAPEQALDAKRATPLADLYSLGATLYHLIAGRPPFTGAGADLLVQVTEDEPPPLAAPPAVSRLVHRLLEKDPDDRLPTAAVVVKELARLRGA